MLSSRWPRSPLHGKCSRDFAAHRGATAAATTSASVRRSMSCIQEQPTEGVCPNAREKWPDQTLDQAFGLPEVLVAVGTSRLSCKRAGKTRTLMPVWDSSGESRSLRHPRLFLSFYDFEGLLWCCVATFCRHHEARYARMPTS